MYNFFVIINYYTQKTRNALYLYYNSYFRKLEKLKINRWPNFNKK